MCASPWLDGDYIIEQTSKISKMVAHLKKDGHMTELGLDNAQVRDHESQASGDQAPQYAELVFLLKRKIKTNLVSIFITKSPKSCIFLGNPQFS